jgi:CheY-like chemotaxis protein
MLVDIMMPEMDGYVTMQEIPGANPAYRNFPSWPCPQRP